MTKSVIIMFQFHYGTIGSHFKGDRFIYANMFQFHYGTIGSLISSIRLLYLFLFQFHYGTIGRRHRPTK